ncbi:MFS transporter [Planktothricoides sp. FACHB-1370]|uniref:MFS transporter n=3 Tax=Planktothricoides raciborskii TaxID=132608 RepID=A0AAU8JMV2_9CYAN|nr:MFS transporter [Planktothricoides raciborskii FACHB-1370]MBD2584297.1 MFS transporter [Planktothricoides raciborskii FACHB-1261]
MGVFLLVWFGQLISLIGSGMTNFALGVWVYQRTGSVTQFSLILLFGLLPSIVVSPIAGAIVDRWNRRWCMILSDSGAAITTVAVALLLATGSLQLWHIYLAVGLDSIFKAFQLPAYTASTSLLVPKEDLPRANGMVQSAQACAQLVSPLLAGILLGTIKLQGIIVIDFATFLFAVTTLLLVRFPNAKTDDVPVEGTTSLWGEALEGATYIFGRPGLLALLIVFAVDNFVVGLVEVLLTPLVLSFTSVAVLGTIQSIGGAGMLLGGLIMSSWKSPRSMLPTIFAFDILAHLCILTLGLRTSFPLFAVANFLLFFSLPLINGYSNTILLKKVTPDIQGRVFAIINMICWSCIPLAYVIAGPLADRIFEPLMAADGLLAGSVGQIIGVGPGRGIGLLFITMEIIAIIVTVAIYRYPRLRFVERELPDVI